VPFEVVLPFGHQPGEPVNERNVLGRRRRRCRIRRGTTLGDQRLDLRLARPAGALGGGPGDALGERLVGHAGRTDPEVERAREPDGTSPTTATAARLRRSGAPAAAASPASASAAAMSLRDTSVRTLRASAALITPRATSRSTSASWSR
jgi:hypothetical protein